MKSSLVRINKFKEILKNPSLNLQVRVYDEDDNSRGKSMNKLKKEKMTLVKLAEKMDEGFKQVNARIDRIEARLDYNGLKDLPGRRN